MSGKIKEFNNCLEKAMSLNSTVFVSTNELEDNDILLS